MIPRTDSRRTSPPDVALRVVELARSNDAATTPDHSDGSIIYADDDFVMASTYMMIAIHQDSFRKLAE
jgi:hypothetical protein